MRHLSTGMLWAIAGAAIVAAAAAAKPVTLTKSRRFMITPSRRDCDFAAFLMRLAISMEHPVPDFHPPSRGRAEKARPPRGGRASTLGGGSGKQRGTAVG